MSFLSEISIHQLLELFVMLHDELKYAPDCSETKQEVCSHMQLIEKELNERCKKKEA